MRVFVTGASGFIGGAVANRLISVGHDVTGLVRDPAKAALVATQGITPLIGTLDDAEHLTEAARRADAVINTASSDHRGAVVALLAGMEGSGKPFLHTSGSSIVGDEAMGEPSDRVFNETSPISPEPDKAARVAIDRLVQSASGVRAAVLCNTLIYGSAMGVPAQSVQVPRLVAQALKSGIVRYIGRGLNRWSNVHIADVAELYVLALDKVQAGTFLYVENGEASFGDIGRAIGRRLNLPVEPWNTEAAVAEWGREAAVFGLGSNSRVRGHIAREQLGWQPKRSSVTEWIEREMA